MITRDRTSVPAPDSFSTTIYVELTPQNGKYAESMKMARAAFVSHFSELLPPGDAAQFASK